MEESATAEQEKKVWKLLVDDMLFGLAGKPRKWEDWQLSPIQERRMIILNELKKGIKFARKQKDPVNCKLAIILARHFQLLESEPLEIQELYLQVLAMLLVTVKNENPNWFSNLISNPFIFEDQIFWRQIAVHNFSLEYDFPKYNLNWEQWLNYGPAGFESKKCISDKAPNAKWSELNKKLDLLVAMFENHPLQPSLRKDCISIRKRKKEILNGQLAQILLSQSQWYQELFPVYYKTHNYLVKNNLNSMGVPLTNFEVPALIKSLIIQLGESKNQKFVIKLWKREFGKIFSGNCIGNCLAIGLKQSYPAITLPGVLGYKRPAGILDYLVDKGIQVVEIREVKNGDEYVVGQCYPFIFLDKGKPVLIADSIDFHPYYHLDRRKALNLRMKKELFEFLKNYARAIGIEKVVLGKNGPMLKLGKRHEIGNDIDVSDLPVITFEKIEKLSGYWNHRPYFLESIGGTEAYQIL